MTQSVKQTFVRYIQRRSGVARPIYVAEGVTRKAHILYQPGDEAENWAGIQAGNNWLRTRSTHEHGVSQKNCRYAVTEKQIAFQYTGDMIAKPNRIRLFEVASGQLGHFTARQAAEQGYGTDDIAYHARQGRFIRELPGVYRLREYPDSPHGPVMAAWLAVGKDRSVVSHDTALDLLELGTIIPNAVHITVPRTRRNLPRLPGVRIHTTTRPIERHDTVVRAGIRITGPVRSILDAAETNLGPEQIEMAVRQALQRGIALPEEFRKGASRRSRRVGALIDRAVTEAGGT